MRHKGVTMATSNVETSKKGYAAFDKGDVAEQTAAVYADLVGAQLGQA